MKSPLFEVIGITQIAMLKIINVIKLFFKKIILVKGIKK